MRPYKTGDIVIYEGSPHVIRGLKLTDDGGVATVAPLGEVTNAHLSEISLADSDEAVRRVKALGMEDVAEEIKRFKADVSDQLKAWDQTGVNSADFEATCAAWVKRWRAIGRSTDEPVRRAVLAALRFIGQGSAQKFLDQIRGNFSPMGDTYLSPHLDQALAALEDGDD